MRMQHTTVNPLTALQRSAFTLVELLLVVAIIALLLGLLIPTVNHVRTRAKEMVSQSNMKQWGVGSVNFATER